MSNKKRKTQDEDNTNKQKRTRRKYSPSPKEFLSNKFTFTKKIHHHELDKPLYGIHFNYLNELYKDYFCTVGGNFVFIYKNCKDTIKLKRVFVDSDVYITKFGNNELFRKKRSFMFVNGEVI